LGVRHHAQPDALARQALGRGHAAAPSLSAFVAFIFLVSMPDAARSDWSLATEAGVRHDSNVGNAQSYSDITADTVTFARVSAFQLFTVGEDYTVTVGGDLGGESFHALDGLSNASMEGVFALRKKWGLGAFAPWARIGASAGRTDYHDGYRNAWIYRATLASGRRIDARWNLWADYAYEQRAANSQEEVAPGLSGDAFSQNSHSLAVNLEYALRESIVLSLRVSGRHGDVVSTTEPNSKAYYSAKALAEDPAFGDEDYAYRLLGTSYGFRAGINYSPTAHTLLGFGFSHFETHADGDNRYMKSIPEITWDYHF
jgi:long-subunit fatty acid transport protein